MTNKHLNIHVIGLVQGVSFRHYTTLKANELGLKGFVRNEANGSVYIEVEGETAALETFVKWCHQGSPMAEVQRVELSESSPLKNFSSFQTSYR